MPDSALSVRRCPVCGSSSSELLYQQRFASFSRGSIGDGYDVVACHECGMCFATGLPDERRFAQYYADSSKYDLSAEAARLSARETQRLATQAAFVAAHVTQRDEPVLDVGTATGGFSGRSGKRASASRGWSRAFAGRRPRGSKRTRSRRRRRRAG